MRFALGEWVDRYEGLRHDLARSGMKGVVRPASGAGVSPDPAELRRRLGERHGVEGSRVFLFAGATEANAVVLAYLGSHRRARTARRPSFHVDYPEYPQLYLLPQSLGWSECRGSSRVDVSILSQPGNPTGRARSPEMIRAIAARSGAVVADESFREYTTAPSVQRLGLGKVWSTGTFTKAFGGDDIRVGWAIVPEEESERFEHFHSIAADKLCPRSVSAALATLDRAPATLAIVRSIFRSNRSTLRAAMPGTPDLSAPVHFDRGVPRGDGDGLAQEGLRRGVLVSPGSFFGEPAGVRICLTRRSFPADLRAHLRLRVEFAERRTRSRLQRSGPGR